MASRKHAPYIAFKLAIAGKGLTLKEFCKYERKCFCATEHRARL